LLIRTRIELIYSKDRSEKCVDGPITTAQILKKLLN
jgi:hypothetical protein